MRLPFGARGLLLRNFIRVGVRVQLLSETTFPTANVYRHRLVNRALITFLGEGDSAGRL